jgi:predicted transcriptional regulator
MMENYLCNIFWITIVTGLFGGLINFLLLDNEKELSLLKFFRSTIIGIGAAFVVPLFLETISSDLINQCKDDSKYYFIYAGFCLIASIFSRRFLNTIADKVIKQAEQAEKKAEQAVSIATEKEDKIQAFVTKNTEPDEEIEFTDLDIKTVETDLKGKVRDDVKDILTALKKSKYTYRTAKGIAKEINSDLKVIEIILEELEEQDLVRKFINTDNNKVLWTLTEKGNKFKIHS